MVSMLIIIINLLVVFAFLFSVLLSNIKPDAFMKSIDKKEHGLYLVYPLADYLLNKTPLGNLINKKNSKEASIKALYVTARPEQTIRLFWCGKLSLVIVIFAVFNLLSLFNQLAASSASMVLDGKYLRRPGYGEGSTQVNLDVTLENTKEDSGQEGTSKTREIQIDIDERVYTKEEREDIFEKAIEYLWSTVLAGNKALDQVNTDLNFIDKIPGTAVTVEWKPEDMQLIETDGTVNNQEISEEWIKTSVQVLLLCQGEGRELTMNFLILPGTHSEEDALVKELQEKIKGVSQETAADPMLKLPDTLGEYQLIWKDKREENGTALLYLGMIAAFLAWIGLDKELDRKIKRRKEQMLSDYPELINKFTLLVNAGMTIRQAWTRISEDYGSKSAKEKNKKRYAYEEMLTAANELKLGMPESIVYEQYGRKIGLIPYIKFTSLISQNLKKGNKGFTELLMKEAKEAFEERKETAKRLGEEAGTKLLLPMTVLLLMVFLIILIPAFLAFRI